MKNRISFRKIPALLLGCVAAVVLSDAALAQHGGGHVSAGGGHFGGSVHAYGGGYRGGYGGYRGGYGGYGYRGGWGYRGGYYGGWGWGLGGLGLGLYFASLPLYYSTYWWGGVPYYYSNDVYYRYDTSAGQYVTVAPPPEVAAQVPADGSAAGASASAGTELMAYPKNGQSTEQQGKDKYECHHWAATQTGFDPTQGSSAAPAAKRSDYVRAQAACLEGRGYSVR